MEKMHKAESGVCNPATPAQGYAPGDELELDVTALASDGRGLGRVPDGPVCFADDALPGQRVLVSLTRTRSRLLEGRVAAVLSPSPAEREAPCLHAEACGGCPWQKLPYEEQLRWKSRVFYDALQRVGGMSVTEQPIISAPEEWGYRNKMSFVFGDDGSLGQRGRRSHSVVNLTDCRLQDSLTMRLLEQIREVVAECSPAGMPPGGWRHVVVRRPRAGGLGVELIVGPGNRVRGEALYAALHERFPELTAFALTQRTAKSEVALGERTLFTAGNEEVAQNSGKPRGGELFEILHRPDGSEVRLGFDHTAFLQINTAAAERLYAEVLASLKPAGTERLWDLYCGVGSVGLFMAPYVGEVCGVDSVPGAISRARKNAGTLPSESASKAPVRFETADVAALFGDAGKTQKLFGRTCGPDDLVVVDPPRAGLEARLITQLLQAKPRRIVYVSCNPATLARDAGLLSAGYTLTHARPVDLFPQTPHVEGVTVWDRK